MLRLSQVSPTPHTKKLQAQDADVEDVLYPEDKYIVGFWGYSSRLRIVGLGIISRVIIKQYVFSYYWIKEETATMDFDEDRRKSVPMAATRSRREREHDEELRLKKLEEQRLKEKETEDMAALEFSYLVRMRRSNVNSALERSETFARQLWTSRAIQLNWKLNVFAKVSDSEELSVELRRRISETSVLNIALANFDIISNDKHTSSLVAVSHNLHADLLVL